MRISRRPAMSRSSRSAARPPSTPGRSSRASRPASGRSCARSRSHDRRRGRASRHRGVAGRPVPLIVGTNHLFDPAWGRAKHHLHRTGGPRAERSRSPSSLPPNGRYHEVVTESPAGRSAPGVRTPDSAEPASRRRSSASSSWDSRCTTCPRARSRAALRAGRLRARRRPDRLRGRVRRRAASSVQLTAVMLPAGADALWRMTVATSGDRVDVTFPPAFVHGGSAAVVCARADGRDTTYPRDADDGYVAEWRALADGDRRRGVRRRVRRDARRRRYAHARWRTSCGR